MRYYFPVLSCVLCTQFYIILNFPSGNLVLLLCGDSLGYSSLLVDAGLMGFVMFLYYILSGVIEMCFFGVAGICL